jgi:hypothetical protein
MHVSRTEHEKIASTYWSLILQREGEKPVELGTMPDIESVIEWFEGAYGAGVLPNPPLYTDEIRAFECVGEHRAMKFVWRLAWMQFEAKRLQLV